MIRLCITAALLAFATSTSRPASRLPRLDYSDLEGVGASCQDRDSCANMSQATVPPKFNDRNCECDMDCHLYSDCCIDSPRVLSGNRQSTRPLVNCYSINGSHSTGAYMVDRCRRDYTGSPEVWHRCLMGGDPTDPLMNMPATDRDNGITYLNRYCAECNHAIPDKLTPWIIRVSCEELVQRHNVSQEYVFSNLEYRESVGSWGVDYMDGDEPDFFACKILYDLPEHLAVNARLCRYNLVSTCPSTWRRSSIKRKCHSYTAVVYHANVVYRNPHCALCHNVAVNVMACNSGIVSRSKQPLSFALLLDVGGDGDEVGRTRLSTRSCPGNQKYDPFFKRCRTLVCALPGFHQVDGRCVQD